MTDKPRQLYAKFKMSKKKDVMTRMFLSEDLDAANEWVGEKRAKAEPQKDEEKKSTSLFLTVAKDFEASINVFQNSVPYIMQIMPLMRSFTDDQSLRGFVKTNGEMMETGEFELYKLNVAHIGEISRRIERLTSIGSGINSLPRLFILGMISSYDAFLAQLIKAIFQSKPEMLSPERSVSLKELRDAGSVEAVLEKIIEKEVETVIRSSHAEQIEWLEKRLNMPLTKNLKILPHFIEICERRNLFTHTGGIVSSQYLKVCKDHGFETKNNVGDSLTVDPEYYENAVSITREMGIKLTQVVWRKLKPEELAIAATELNEFSYRLISKRKYKAAVTMFEFGLYVVPKVGPDDVKKRMIVNYANALKLSGDKTKAFKVLDEEDWSAANDAYAICIAGVRDDVDTVIKMMKRVVDAGLIRISCFREWAAFDTVRTDLRFIEAFEREFGERLVENRETSSVPRADSSSDREATDGVPLDVDADDVDDKTIH